MKKLKTRCGLCHKIPKRSGVMVFEGINQWIYTCLHCPLLAEIAQKGGLQALLKDNTVEWWGIDDATGESVLQRPSRGNRLVKMRAEAARPRVR